MATAARLGIIISTDSFCLISGICIPGLVEVQNLINPELSSLSRQPFDRLHKTRHAHALPTSIYTHRYTPSFNSYADPGLQPSTRISRHQLSYQALFFHILRVLVI